MDELRKLAESILERVDTYESLKVWAIDEDEKQEYRTKIITCSEIVSSIYERILEIQKQN